MKKTDEQKLATMSAKKLWELRQEIVLNSVFLADYRNSQGLDEHAVCSFFDGYLEQIDIDIKAIRNEEGEVIEEWQELDTKQELKRWQSFYACGIA